MSHTDDIIEIFIRNPGITFTAKQIADILGVETKFIHVYLNRAMKWFDGDLKTTASEEKASNGHYVKLYTYTPDFGTSDE